MVMSARKHQPIAPALPRRRPLEFLHMVGAARVVRKRMTEKSRGRGVVLLTVILRLSAAIKCQHAKLACALLVATGALTARMDSSPRCWPFLRAALSRVGYGLLVMLLMAPVGMAQEKTPLPIARGDVLAIAVIQDSSFDREAKVDAQGKIMLPQLGSFEVVGRSLDELVDLIGQKLIDLEILREPTVVVETAAYRPLYVDGAVRRPGAVDYEPGLTVRHALVLAGGIERSSSVQGFSVTDLLALNSEWRLAAYKLLEVNSRIARLQGELQRVPDLVVPGQQAGPINQAASTELQSLDSSLLADRLEAWKDDQAHMQDLNDLIDYELDILAAQSEQQGYETDLQTAELQAARTLLERGVISAPRLRDLEREQSRLSRDLLAIRAQTARTRQTKETLSYELESSDRKWRMEIRSALREAVQERIGLQASVELLSASLLEAGIELTNDNALAPAEPELVIYRVTGGEEKTLKAVMSTEMLPGDVLEVSIPKVPQG